MIITDIVKTKRGRYSVFVDDEFLFSVDDETAAEYHLKAGRETNPEELETIKETTNNRWAKEKAYQLLSYRDHSSKDLHNKLKRTISEEAAGEAVEKMQELGLIDDERYAYALAKDLFHLKCFAARRVEYELIQKGINRELARQAVEECAAEPADQIDKLMRTKFRSYPRDEKGKRRIQDHLTRLGHNWEDIRSALSNFLDTDEYMD